MLPLVIPLWGKLLLFGVAKKLTVLAAARLYGFPPPVQAQPADRQVRQATSVSWSLRRRCQSCLRAGLVPPLQQLSESAGAAP